MIKKKQHYVSRFYLKQWSNNNRLYCLRNNKLFQSNLMNIAHENYFYKLKDLTEHEKNIIQKLVIEPSPKFLQPLHKDFLNKFTIIFDIKNKFKDSPDIALNHELEKTIINMEEDYHCGLENIGLKYINLILQNNVDFYYDTEKESRMEFLSFLTVQYMRTKKRREESIKIKTNLVNVEQIWPILSHILATNLSYNLHLDKGFNLQLLCNETDIDFIAGDQPVINTYSVDKQSDLKHSELEFFYPISPKLAILLSNEICERKKTISDRNIIDNYNHLIMKSSENQIYANTENQLKKYIK